MKWIFCVIALLFSLPLKAEYGIVSEEGYKVPLQDAMQKIVPADWGVYYQDNEYRAYQIHWYAGSRWSEVLHDVGSRFDIAFVLDARDNRVYVSDTDELRRRGINMVNNNSAARLVGLEKVVRDSIGEELNYSKLVSTITSNKAKLIDKQHRIDLMVRAYEDIQGELSTAQSDALRYGVPIDNTFGADLDIKEVVHPTRFIVTSEAERHQLVAAGDVITSLAEYFANRWGYQVSKLKDSLKVDATLPYSIRLPGISVEDDLRLLSKSMNHDDNDVSVYFRVVKSGVNGQIGISFQKRTNHE